MYTCEFCKSYVENDSAIKKCVNADGHCKQLARWVNNDELICDYFKKKED